MVESNYLYENVVFDGEFLKERNLSIQSISVFFFFLIAINIIFTLSVHKILTHLKIFLIQSKWLDIFIPVTKSIRQ